MIPFSTCPRGKLLLTGEYFVLDGAAALALPVRYGQCLHASPGADTGRLSWTSRDHTGTAWFHAVFQLPGLAILQTEDEATADTLQRMLLACRRQHSDFLTETDSLQITTQTDFPRAWGLGTSSTLLAALGRWAGVNPYQLLAETLGGSGYDIACAYAEGPLLYQLKNGLPQVAPVSFDPPFKENIYFIYLGKKQDSRKGIAHYREKIKLQPELVQPVTELTHRCLAAGDLHTFETVLEEHETFVSRLLELPRVRDLYFSDYWGKVKSLGAWGGDFILATSNRSAAETRQYFNEKDFQVFLDWSIIHKS